jgi:hypothetical protein
MFEYDKSSKWLIQHHGDAILRLAGITDIETWKPLQAEVVLPRRLPDGLLEVRFRGEKDTDLFILELSTYPDLRVAEQILRDTELVHLDKGVLPEALVLVLCPKGQVQVASEIDLSSRRGWSSMRSSWRVVELWTLPAEKLLSSEDPGLMPWVPLTTIAGPPKSTLERCRAVIDTKAKAEEHENLLAVTQILGSLRYNKELMKSLFGGNQPMIESPLLQEIVEEAEAKGINKGMAKAKQQDIISILGSTFMALPDDIISAVNQTSDVTILSNLIVAAARCKDLADFRKQLLMQGTEASE